MLPGSSLSLKDQLKCHSFVKSSLSFPGRDVRRALWWVPRCLLSASAGTHLPCTSHHSERGDSGRAVSADQALLFHTWFHLILPTFLAFMSLPCCAPPLLPSRRHGKGLRTCLRSPVAPKTGLCAGCALDNGALHLQTLNVGPWGEGWKGRILRSSGR